MEVILYPAIDLMDGRVVRLLEGDPKRATTYPQTPLAVVDRFCRAGASWLHVVDLSGAFAGAPAQRDGLENILDRAHAHGAKVQLSGGLRSEEAVCAALDAGADRVVIGTLAVTQPQVAARLCRAHPGKVAVAVDARDGYVTTHGWRRTTNRRVVDLAREAAGWGAAAVLFTDVTRDGTGHGAAVDAAAALQRAVSVDVLASGGVADLSDLRALRRAGVRGAVVGRALYEGAFSLEEALAAC